MVRTQLQPGVLQQLPALWSACRMLVLLLRLVAAAMRQAVGLLSQPVMLHSGACNTAGWVSTLAATAVKVGGSRAGTSAAAAVRSCLWRSE